MYGAEPLEGTVEVCFSNTYGSICDNHWNEYNAQVVCQSLGYNSTDASAFSHAFYGTSSGPIHLTRVQCTGNEPSLANCSFSQNTQECTHGEDAGVSCSGDTVVVCIGIFSTVYENCFFFCRNLSAELYSVASRHYFW